MAASKQSSNIQHVGYTEMYEWVRPPKARAGKFVQFSKRYPEMIELCKDDGAILAGVSTVRSAADSDNPEQWKYAYLMNEVGDIYMKEEVLAVGVKCYDQHQEFSYISTRPWRHYIKVPSKEYNPSQNYIPRTGRHEWTRVALLGKVIVYDNGACTPGQFCMPYTGDDMQQAGNAVPWDGKSKTRMYVLDRISDTTVEIVLNSINTEVGGK